MEKKSQTKPSTSSTTSICRAPPSTQPETERSAAPSNLGVPATSGTVAPVTRPSPTTIPPSILFAPVSAFSIEQLIQSLGTTPDALASLAAALPQPAPAQQPLPLQPASQSIQIEQPFEEGGGERIEVLRGIDNEEVYCGDIVVVGEGEAEAGGEPEVVSTERNIEKVEMGDDLEVGSGADKAMVEVVEADVERENVGEELEIKAGNQPGIQGGLAMEVLGVDVVIGGDDLIGMEGGRDAVAEPAEAGDEEVEQRVRPEEVVVVIDGDDEEEVPEMPVKSPNHVEGTRAEDFLFFGVNIPEVDIMEAEVDASCLRTRRRSQGQQPRTPESVQQLRHWEEPIETTP